VIVGRTRDERLFEPEPKRILVLDGGGDRDVFNLAYLERLEAILWPAYLFPQCKHMTS
jgi:hypothetical protein